MATTTQLPGSSAPPCRPLRPAGPGSAGRSARSSPRSAPSGRPTGRCSPWSWSRSGSARWPAWAPLARREHGPLFDATQRSLAGLYLSQLIIAVLGALMITSEYSTGMIRTSLTVQPRRGTVLAAKGVVFVLVAWSPA